jgi:hypothetical protein
VRAGSGGGTVMEAKTGPAQIRLGDADILSAKC